MRSRWVSKRRTVAVIAAVLAVPWPLWVTLFAISEDEPLGAAVGAGTLALIVAVPVLAGRRRWPWLPAGVAVLLFVLGTLGVLAGGALLWPGALLFFVVAALPAHGSRWRLGRVVAWAAGVAALCALGVAAALVIGDARDDPDLEVRLRSGRASSAFSERLLHDPHVTSVGSTPAGPDVSVELVEGLTPDMRERLVADLRQDPRVATVRVVDEGLWR